MHLVNGHRAFKGVALLALGHIFPVIPRQRLPEPDLRAGAGTGFAMNGIGVGFFHRPAVRTDDAVFVNISAVSLRNQHGPDTAAHRRHGVRGRIPTVEIADDGNRPGMGRPERKLPAAQRLPVMTAEEIVSVGAISGEKRVQLMLRNCLFRKVFRVHEHSSILPMRSRFFIH